MNVQDVNNDNMVIDINVASTSKILKDVTNIATNVAKV